MTATRVRSGLYYQRRKKLVAVEQYPRPIYTEDAANPHARPVTPVPSLRPVDSPGTKVLTEDPGVL